MQKRPPPPPRPANRQPLIIGIAIGAVALVLVIAYVAMSGDAPTTPRRDRPVAETPKPPETTKPPPPPPPPPVKQETEEERWKREIEERKQKSAEALEDDAEQLYRTVRRQIAQSDFVGAEKTLATLASKCGATKFVAEKKKEIDALATAARNRSQIVDATFSPSGGVTKADCEKRLRDKQDAARRRLDEAAAAMKAELGGEGKRLADLKAKLGGAKFDLRTRAGQTMRGATVAAIQRDGVRIAYSLEGGQVEADVPWDMLDDKSFHALVSAMHKGTYELGLLLVGRRMWKEAQAAFEECARADASLKPRIPDLTKVIRGEGAFRVPSRRVGRDAISVAYDFAKPEQASDFVPKSAGEIAVTPEGLSTKASGEGWWTLRDLDFLGECTIDATVTGEKDGWVAFALLRNWDGHGYEVSLGEGFRIDRVDKAGRQTLVGKPEARLTGEAAVRVTIRQGAIKVTVNGKDALAASDTTYKQGWCAIGAWRATCVYRRVSFEGRVNPVQLDKLLAESEVLVRRAMHGLDAAATAGVAAPLSAEDPFYLQALNAELRGVYDKARATAATALGGGAVTEKDVDGALAAFTRIVKAAPEFAAARYWRVRLSFASGQAPDPADMMSLGSQPEFYEAMAFVGELMRRSPSEARRCIDAALLVMPDYAPAIGLRGFLKFVALDTKGAMEDIELAMRLDPTDEEVRRRHRVLVNTIRGPEVLGCRHKAETAHYNVLTDISPERTKLYAERLEACYRHFAEFFKEGFREDGARPKPRVAVFNTREAFLTFSELTSLDRPEHALGYYSHELRHLVLFEDADEQETLETLYHEACHHFVALMVPDAPYWFNEGIAEYLSAIRVDKGKVVEKGRLQTKRLKIMQSQIEFAIPFERIMLNTPAEFYDEDMGLKYAQAWSMLHFFYEGAGGRHRKLMEEYWRALLADKGLEGSFKAAFGRADLKKLQAEWRSYVEGLK